MNPAHRNEYALLQQVQVRQQARRIAAQQFARQLAPDFSLLEYLRRNEMAISEYLALLLDPAGSHGQGPLFLHRFLQVLSTGHPDAAWAMGSQFRRIQREKSIEGGRMDIHLELDRGCICIENKPWAADQIGQLRNYARHLEQSAQGKFWMLVYLCDASPSAVSIDEKQLLALEGEGHFIWLQWPAIVTWLGDCALHVQAPAVRLFVDALVQFVRQKIIREPSMEDTQEIVTSMIATPANVESSIRIAQAVQHMKRELLRKTQEQMQKMAAAPGDLVAHWDADWQKSRRWIGFEFDLGLRDLRLRYEVKDLTEANYFYWGIRTSGQLTEPDAVVWPEIQRLMESHHAEGQVESPHWPWWQNLEDDAAYEGQEPAIKAMQPWVSMAQPSGAQDFASTAMRRAKDVKALLHASAALGSLLAGAAA
ncbi:PDDEXK-like family protein [Acidovorax sp. NCPPB 3576]|uniref:PDDEXK-like family protein n=1 Tax=Acidovorax sp. NCPPB 3576 TaxID=2940488 RepID=UPI00234B13D5|nr:PD-(D/E)XK nuclease family protein [Acidovorax sp. NCPPB 3576]WCM88264.1 PD-(D/E)XK nuclease family protein [Acidovorax sp. NCPPB 3576]